MEFSLDPVIATILFGAVTVGCGYLLGKWKGEGDKEETVNNTIDWLIESGFVKAREEADGSVSLIPLNEQKKRRTRRS
jgi:hypothetical protein